LRAHPSAKDSAKGIAQYWVNENVDTVHQALALLVEEGVMEKRRHIYCLAERVKLPRRFSRPGKARPRKGKSGRRKLRE
jgi:hypothetical protein